MKSFARRLDRLEAETAAVCRAYPMHVVYVGDPAPAEDDSWSLTIWVHRAGCDTPDHNGSCVLPRD
jgi:hypothetical protein